MLVTGDSYRDMGGFSGAGGFAGAFGWMAAFQAQSDGWRLNFPAAESIFSLFTCTASSCHLASFPTDYFAFVQPIYMHIFHPLLQ